MAKDKASVGREYWATKKTKEIGGDLFARIDEFYSDLETSGYFQVLKKSYRSYYGSSESSLDGSMFDSSYIMRAGEQGELHKLKVNHYRNLIQHILVLTTNPRPNLQSRATNSDYKSQAQTILSDGVLEYYLREKKLERFAKLAAEYGIVFAAGWISMGWDATAGEKYGVNPETGKLINTGDIKLDIHSPLDIILDVHRENSAFDWLIKRAWENKYDLIAQYPELEEEIFRVEGKDNLVTNFTFASHGKNFPSDQIPVYTFYHDKTDALPEGRMLTLVTEEAILYDGPLPYRKMPLYRIAPSEFIGSPYGFSPTFDLLGLQDAVDSLYSAVVTNNLTFATQNLWGPRGANINVTHLRGGLNYIETDPTMPKPEPLQLTASPPETYQLIKIMENTMEIFAGINSVVRGQPEDTLKSGAALALVASQALQFSSGLQQSYVQLLEDLGTGLVHMLQDYATVPRMAMIVGKHNRSYIKEFKGHDLDQIDRVTVDVGSPVSRTTAGRVDMANNLLQAGLLQNPEEYLQVIQTGKIEPLTQGKTSENLLIASENERLRDGQLVVAVAIDDHRLHIVEHKAVLANPESRETPNVVQAALTHINEHLALLRETDPALLSLIGQQPLQPAPPPAPTATEAGAMTNIPATMNYGSNLEAQMPSMPNMPKNPMTGEKYQPVTGGLL